MSDYCPYCKRFWKQGGLEVIINRIVIFYKEYYDVVFDKSRIYFSMARSWYFQELGETRDTGLLNFGNPAEADVNILVYDNHAYVYVDDEFIGEYTLSESEQLRGYFGFGLISGTNKDYGTNCHIADSRIWSLDSD